MTAPVFLTARWRHLAMLNWEVERDLLEPLLPAGVELDDWSGAHLAEGPEVSVRCGVRVVS